LKSEKLYKWVYHIIILLGFHPPGLQQIYVIVSKKNSDKRLHNELENHNVSWENSLFRLGHGFNSYFDITRGCLLNILGDAIHGQNMGFFVRPSDVPPGLMTIQCER
jgi:hypothetical protein